jgi:glycosyltransferase involved in cell wall biosynthesis
MKILYLTIGYPSEGVRKKLIDKIAFLSREGMHTRFCIVSAEGFLSDGSFEVIPVNYKKARWLANWPLIWRFTILVEQALKYRSINRYLKGKAFDFIVFRYPVGDYFLWRFVKHSKWKIIFEHNTIEEKELAMRMANSFYYRYFYYGEKIFGRKIRSRAAGIIGVTSEITEFQLRIAKKKLGHTVISNGIDVDRVPVRKGDDYNGESLNLLLLAGSEAPWHGVDILLKSIATYQGKVKIQCYIAGSISEAQKKSASLLNNVTVLSSQTEEKLNRLCDLCHIGIGSMGLSGPFLRQACPLKVREYWARGLPFIIGYEDTDLIAAAEMEPFYLKVDGSLSINEVIVFAGKVYGKPHVAERMRALAYETIHYAIKAKQYASFLNRLNHG